MFRSHDHPQGAYIVPSLSYSLKHSVNSFVTLTLVHTTRNHNQAHSKQHTTHTQNTTRCHSTEVNLMK